jgi:hypothetical protein
MLKLALPMLLAIAASALNSAALLGFVIGRDDPDGGVRASAA